MGSHLAAWCEDKPQLVGMTVQTIAVRLDEMAEAANTCAIVWPEEVPRVHAQRWCRLYRNRRFYCDVLVNVLALGPKHQVRQELKSLFQLLSKWGQENIDKTYNDGGMQAVVNVIASESELVSRFIQRLYQHTSGQDIGSEFKPEQMDELRLVLFFILRIFIPYWYLYDGSMTLLYRKARLGNPDALEDLLRMDKSVLADWLIAEQWHRIMTGSNRALRTRMLRAISRGPKLKATSLRFKIKAAAVVSLVAEFCQHKLETADIQKLFDAMARDCNKQPADSSLPDDERTLYRAIYRRKKQLLMRCASNKTP